MHVCYLGLFSDCEQVSERTACDMAVRAWIACCGAVHVYVALYVCQLSKWLFSPGVHAVVSSLILRVTSPPSVVWLRD